MTGYHSVVDALEREIIKQLERQGVKDPELRREIARQQINTLEALGRLYEVGGYLRYYGSSAALQRTREIIKDMYTLSLSYNNSSDPLRSKSMQ
mgnify:CR=1 FL=1